ncbi:MAG: DNA polymerase III subunit delta, partial [Spirochaetales bacterium]
MSKIPSIAVFLGPEEGQRSDEIASLRSLIQKTTGSPADEHRFYLPDGSLDEAVSLLRNGSLFSSHRFVLLHGAELLRKKDEVLLLAAYIGSPASDATLILISDQVRLDSKVEKVIPPAAKKVFWELFDNQKRGWLTSYFRKRGVEIVPEAVDLLLELVQNNTQEMRVEAEKLCIFVGAEGEVNVDAVETFIYHSKQENVFTLFKCIVRDDFGAALETLQTLVSSGEGMPVQIVAGVVCQVRKLLALRQLMDAGNSLDGAFSMLNIRGKRIQADYRIVAERFTAEDLKRHLHVLSEYDAAFRSTRPGLHRCLLDLLMYQMLYRSPILIPSDVEGVLSA